MQYDGKGKLSVAIADLFRLSAKSHNQIADLITQAKTALSITSKARQLPDDVKLAIYRWHYERLNPVQDIKRPEPDSTVQNVKQDITVQDNRIDTLVYDFKQVHFAVTFTHQGQPKRTTVMLEGYLVKALQRKNGLEGNAAIRAWIEQAIKADGVRFDSFAPLTRQVKRIIVESFI